MRSLSRAVLIVGAVIAVLGLLAIVSRAFPSCCDGGLIAVTGAIIFAAGLLAEAMSRQEEKERRAAVQHETK